MSSMRKVKQQDMNLNNVNENDIKKIIRYHPNSDIISHIITINKKTKKETSINDEPSHAIYYESGKVSMLAWKKENKLYREESYYEDGNYKAKIWYDESEIPIRGISYFPSGNIRRELFPDDEVDIDKPSIIEYEEKPCYHIKMKLWEHLAFKKPRDDLPIYIHYNHLGNPTEMRYPFNNTVGMPTTTVYSEFTGNKLCEEWETYSPSGKRMLHRELKDGPARIHYYQNGKKLREEYILKNELIARYTY